MKVNCTFRSGWPVAGTDATAAMDLPSGKTLMVRFWVEDREVFACATDLGTGFGVMPHFLSEDDCLALEQAAAKCAEQVLGRHLAKIILECGTMH